MRIRIKTGPELEKSGYTFRNGGAYSPMNYFIPGWMFGKTLEGRQFEGGIDTAGQTLHKSGYAPLSKPKSKAVPVKKSAPRKKFQTATWSVGRKKIKPKPKRKPPAKKKAKKRSRR